MERRNFLKGLGALAATIGLAGCGENEEGDGVEPEEGGEEEEDYMVAVDRAFSQDDKIMAFYDEKGEVVIYTHRNGHNAASVGGTSAVPISETGYTPEDFN